MRLRKSNSIKYNFSGINRAFCLKNPKGKYFCDELCPDAICLDLIEKATTIFSFDEKNKESINYNDLKKGRYIIILLESPHSHEYYKGRSRRKNYFPAEGTTCTNLNNYFCKQILNQISELKENKKYRVALVNPIQFQASLGNTLYGNYTNRVIRDDNWERLWNCMHDDFIKRLRCLMKASHKKAVILNFCTIPAKKGKKVFQRKEIISKTILEQFPKIKLYEGPHPCCWNQTLSREGKILVNKIN